MADSQESTSSPGAPSGSGGFVAEISALLTMCTKLANLSSELEAVGAKTASAHPSGDAFGLVGQAFASVLGGMLDQAEQHIQGVSKAANSASGVLKATVTELTENEIAIMRMFAGIADPLKAPEVHDPGPIALRQTDAPSGTVHAPPEVHDPGPVDLKPTEAPSGTVHAPPEVHDPGPVDRQQADEPDGKVHAPLVVHGAGGGGSRALI